MRCFLIPVFAIIRMQQLRINRTLILYSIIGKGGVNMFKNLLADVADITVVDIIVGSGLFYVIAALVIIAVLVTAAILLIRHFNRKKK